MHLRHVKFTAAVGVFQIDYNELISSAGINSARLETFDRTEDSLPPNGEISLRDKVFNYGLMNHSGRHTTSLNI